jgi:hypothetical protein
MNGAVADKATICCKQEIRIRTGQSQNSVKGNTIDCYKNQSREVGSRIKLHPVGSVKGRHIALTTLLIQTTPIFYTPSTPLLSTQSTKRRMDGNGRTYVG